jgi:predicted HicB family RNase H-like nuclease
MMISVLVLNRTMTKPKTEPPAKRVTVQIGREIHKKLKIEAASREKTIFDLLSEILEKHLILTKES